MTQAQEVDFSIMDSEVWSETDQKIAQIKNILKEEGVDSDPELMSAIDEAVKDSLLKE